MHALLIPVGSTGDVLPFCGLGQRLRARGHDVTVAANPHFATLVARAGLDFAPLGDADDYEALCDSRAFVDRARGFRLVMEYAAALLQPVYELAAAHRSSTVIAHPLAMGARLAERRHGVRAATLLLSPAILDSANSWLKRFLIDRIAPRPLGSCFRFGEHRVVGMFPRWFAEPQRDWPRQLALADFPLHDDAPCEDDGALDEADQFFAAGAAPIVFTPGTGNRRARRFFAAAVEATQRLGARAVLLTSHRAQLPPSLPAGVRHFSYLPLSRFLPRASALVHHGGIGSAAVALAAGVPQLVLPFAHDQPDNAARLCRLGVAAALSPRRAHGARVAAALERLVGSSLTTIRCRESASRLRGSDGLGAAAALLDGAGNRLAVGSAA